MVAEVLLAVVGGLVLGSFLNVVIHRLPRGESLVAPRSHCPGCQAPIRPWHNVPVLSWMLLGGHCRDCRAPIDVRYPLVEALTAALFAGVVLARSSAAGIALGLILIVVLIPAALIDLDHRIIPNKLLLPAAAAALVLGTVLDPGHEAERLIAGAAAGGFLFVAAMAYPRGMGMGDVKLAAVLGLCLGRGVGVAMLVALLVGVLVGAAVMARKGARAGRKTAVPFGPMLGLGGLVGFFAGSALAGWYLSTFV